MTKGKNLGGKVFSRRVELRLMSDLALFKRSLKLVKNGICIKNNFNYNKRLKFK
jgi:hypothetical protein